MAVRASVGFVNWAAVDIVSPFRCTDCNAHDRTAQGRPQRFSRDSWARRSDSVETAEELVQRSDELTPTSVRVADHQRPIDRISAVIPGPFGDLQGQSPLDGVGQAVPHVPPERPDRRSEPEEERVPDTFGEPVDRGPLN